MRAVRVPPWQWLLVPAAQRALVSDEATRPRAASVRELPSARPIEVIQQPGEIIFVPSAWYHEVENLDDAGVTDGVAGTDSKDAHTSVFAHQAAIRARIEGVKAQTK